ncbi:MAG: hypothetical protein NVSMB51_13430 [Solirubrobacteraceae bacterium]
MATEQKSLEMILARNLLTALSTPALLVDVAGRIIFFNEPAAVLIGKRFEETGPMSHEQWRSSVGPFDEAGELIPYRDLPLTIALRAGEAAHTRHMLRPSNGSACEYNVTGLPIVASAGGFRGAMIFFWCTSD